jgi:hypothetical protein
MSVRDPMKCHAHNRSGGTCGQWAMHGQSVCFLHGGRAPQALKKAEERMRDLVDPALNSLSRQINADQFAAVKYVLDWAGFHSETVAQTDTSLTVTVHFDHASPDFNQALDTADD